MIWDARIEWYEWIYSISRNWDVFSESRIAKRLMPDWTPFNLPVKSRKLLQSIWKRWYYIFVVSKDWKRDTKTLHRELAKAFITRIEWKSHVNHKDWNKLNNDILNLEWCTTQENHAHACTTWLMNWNREAHRGSNNYQSKKIYQYDINNNLVASYMWTWEAQRATWIWWENIKKVCKGRRKTTWWFIWSYINNESFTP